MTSCSNPRRAQAGASLIEVMISTVLALLITAALFQVYVSSKQTYRLQEALIRRQENLRYATLVLTRDLRSAEYRGCLTDAGQIRNTLNDADAFLYDFDRHVQGFEGVDSSWSPSLDPSLGSVLPGTDVLTLRKTFEPVAYITQAMPETAADLKVQEDLDPPPFAQSGDIVLISDCGGAAVFQITQYTARSGNIVHNTGNTGVRPGNATKDLGRRYGDGAEIMRVGTVSYLIRDGGAGPALWRHPGGTGTASELIEGIENMQVLYGEDTDGDRTPERYVHAHEVSDWKRVTAVRVALLAVAPMEVLDRPSPRTYTLLDTVVGPFGDRRLRHVITFTVTLRGQS